MINNPQTNNYPSYPSFTSTSNYANLRENTENSNPNNNKNNNKSKHKPLSQQTSSSTISHATRIEPTNLSYKDLLRKHQFTPQSGDSTPQTSPMKQEFDLNNNNNNNNKSSNTNNNIISNKDNMTPLELEIATFRCKPIIEEPKKPVSGYQLFAKWKRREKPDEIDNNYPQSKALSIEWNALTQQQRDAWNKKSDQEKLQYQHNKELWLKYVKEAKTLGIPVPTKSVKPMIQQIKIKNLLNLIPDICKSNKETTFLISKATEMFIQCFASKAIDIQARSSVTPDSNNDDNDAFITSLHCFDALQTSHQFNFLRAVTVKPANHMKNIKKRKRVSKKQMEKDTSDPPKKKRKIETDNNNNNDEDVGGSSTTTNQIITNHNPSIDTTTSSTTAPTIVTPTTATTYPTYAYQPYIANGSYSHGYYGQPMINGMQPHGTTVAPFSTIYQPPNPFTHAGYSPKYAINNNINNTQPQIVNVQQIFGSDE